MEISFKVSADYSADGSRNTTAFNLEKINSVKTAINDARGIINAENNSSDYEKLVAYKNAICERTSYNDAAAANPNTPYGDPWQMIYVFDGKADTEVVCEGYSKAFQYLCDHTEFENDTDCITVSGIMTGGTGEGRHMWNIVRLEDSYIPVNYIADVTNSDAGSIGDKGGLFISPAMEGGSVEEGYSFDVDENGTTDVTYQYNDNTKNLYSESELRLSARSYGQERIALEKLFFDGVQAQVKENGEGEWAHFYSVDGQNGTISLEDMNVSVQDANGDIVDPDDYDIEVYYISDEDEEEEGDESSNIISGPFGLQEEDKTEEKGFSEYVLNIEPKGDSDYSGYLGGYFYVMDKYSLNFICSEASYDNAVWSGGWRQHQSFKFYEEPNGPSVKLSSVPEAEAQLTLGDDFDITYYYRGHNPYDWEEYFNTDNPVLDNNDNPCVPTEPGEYFARIQGKEPYYGGNDVLIDIGGLFLNGDGAPDLWSNKEKEYTVATNLPGEVQFTIGVHGRSDNWSDPNEWELVLDKGELEEGEAYYTYDPESKKLTLYGDAIFRKTGEQGLDIVAFIIGEDEDDVEFTHEFLEVREAKEEYIFPEDREMLPGWDDRIDGWGNVFIRNEAEPWGRDDYYQVKSIEVTKGRELLQTFEKNEGEDAGCYFRIIDWDDWKEGDFENDEIVFHITYYDYYENERQHDFTVTVVPEIYELHLENPDNRYTGLPGHEFDVRADARHTYFDEEGCYRDDAEEFTYKWSYAVGSELTSALDDHGRPADEDWKPVTGTELTSAFADFTITGDGSNGHLKFKELLDDQQEDEFYIKAELTGLDDKDEEIVYTGDWMEISCCDRYEMIYPFTLDDLEVGQEIESQEFLVREYSTENQTLLNPEGFRVVEADDMEFTWNSFGGDPVSIFELSGGEPTPVEYGEPTGSNIFRFRRHDEQGGEYSLEAEWSDEDEPHRVESRYNFNNKDYNIRFDEHDVHLYTDIYDYNKAHENDEDFEETLPSNRLDLGDRLGKDWEEDFDLALTVGHWKDDGTEEGIWIEDEILEEQTEGFFSLIFPRDYTVSTDEDGNTYVTLTDHYLKKVENRHEEFDNVRVRARLYNQGADPKETPWITETDAWFHIQETRVDYRDMPEDEDILPDEYGEIHQWNVVWVENTEYWGGNDFDYEVIDVRITAGWDYLVNDCYYTENGEHYVVNDGDTWWYKIKRSDEITQENPEVSFEVTYRDYDNTEKSYVFTRTIVREKSSVWIDLNGGSDNGGPGAQFALTAAAELEYVDENGNNSRTDKGFTFDYAITEGEDYASLTHEEGSPDATLIFSENSNKNIDELIRVKVIAYRKDGNGDRYPAAENEREFHLTDNHTELFFSLDGGVTWVTNVKPELMPGDSCDIKFELRHYDSNATEGYEQDANGKYYVIPSPEYRWDFENDWMKIYAVGDNDEATEIDAETSVKDTDTFRFKRYDNNRLSIIVNTDYSAEEDSSEPFDYRLEFDYVERNLGNYYIEVVKEDVISNENWRIVIGAGDSLDKEDFAVMWDGKELPAEAYELKAYEKLGWNEESGQDEISDEVAWPLTAGKNYRVTATLDENWSEFYEGEVRSYDFNLFSDTSVESYHTKFVDEVGSDIPWTLDDMSITPFEDWFFMVQEGTQFHPVLFREAGESGEVEYLDPQYYKATYKECRFDGHSWAPIDENDWSEACPTTDGVYVCVVEGLDPYSGVLQWIDLIKVRGENHEHYLNHYEAKQATCYAEGNSEYWFCANCNKFFGDADGTNEIQENSWVITAGHDLEEHEAVEPTCTAPGSRAYWKCTICERYFSDSEGKNEIAYESWLIPEDPGVHAQLVPHAAVAKTCTTAGNTAYWECEACHKYFGDANAENEIEANSWIIPAGHDLVSYAAKAKTCTTDGNTAYWSCNGTCGKFFSDANAEHEITAGSWVIPASHDLEKHEAVAATCTAAGNSAYWSCNGTCGKFFSDANAEHEITAGSWVISADPNAHTQLTPHAAVGKTCTTAGNSAYWECEACGKYFSDSEGKHVIEENSWVIPAGHEWGDWVVTTPATDPSGGVETRECSACHEKQTRPLGHEHTLVETPAVAKTCTTPGNSAYWTCSSCGKFFSDANGENEITENSWVIPAGHDLVSYTAKAKTCTTDGNTAYWSCNGTCGKFFSDANAEHEITAGSWVIAASHELTEHPAVAKTCTTAGNSAYWSCSDCGKYFSDAAGTQEVAENSWVIPASHKLTETPAVAKTCTTDGNSAYWSCSECGKYFSDEACEHEIAAYDWVIPAGHTLTAHAAKEKTCTTDGNSAYWSCSVCGKYFSDEACNNEIAANSWIIAKGHEWGEWIEDPVHTETDNGVETRTCAVCGETETRMVPSNQLKTAKEKANAELNRINTGDYSGAERTNVENAIAEARNKIGIAESVAAVEAAMSSARSTIGAQKTNAQKAAEIKPYVKPVIMDLSPVKSLKVKKGKGKLTVKWKKAKKKEQKTFQGYEIQYTRDGSFTDYPAKMVGKKKASVALKKLIRKSGYTVRVRRYRDDGGALHVSDWRIKSGKTK